jgi:hypothetical protein
MVIYDPREAKRNARLVEENTYIPKEKKMERHF